VRWQYCKWPPWASRCFAVRPPGSIRPRLKRSLFRNSQTACSRAWFSTRVSAWPLPRYFSRSGCWPSGCRPKWTPAVQVWSRLSEMSEEFVGGWEGCLSLRDLRGVVPRHASLLLRALDRRGKTVEKRFKGFPARVLQHEIDHLNGIVFIDRMPDMSSLGFEKDIERGAKDES